MCKEGIGVLVLCCLWEVPDGCSCQVNIMNYTLESAQVVGDECFR